MRQTVYERARGIIPKPIKSAMAPLLGAFVGKYQSEMSYWRNRHRFEKRFSNDHYRELMLALAGEANGDFLKGKVVADFGCGPRGSLMWLNGAAAIGIDVLATEYAKAFPDDLREHNMTYVTSTERLIPMPSETVDVMFTLNALDHAADLKAICSEIRRVMKPGALLLGSFNLHEPATAAEPQTLTEVVLDEALLQHFTRDSIRFGRHREGDTYAEMREGRSTYVKGKPGYMWFRGRLIGA